MQTSRRPVRRKGILGEFAGPWIGALLIAPLVLPFLLLSGGHETAALWIGVIAIGTVLAIARAR